MSIASRLPRRVATHSYDEATGWKIKWILAHQPVDFSEKVEKRTAADKAWAHAYTCTNFDPDTSGCPPEWLDRVNEAWTEHERGLHRAARAQKKEERVREEAARRAEARRGREDALREQARAAGLVILHTRRRPHSSDEPAESASGSEPDDDLTPDEKAARVALLAASDLGAKLEIIPLKKAKHRQQHKRSAAAAAAAPDSPAAAAATTSRKKKKQRIDKEVVKAAVEDPSAFVDSLSTAQKAALLKELNAASSTTSAPSAPQDPAGSAWANAQYKERKSAANKIRLAKPGGTPLGVTGRNALRALTQRQAAGERGFIGTGLDRVNRVVEWTDETKYPGDGSDSPTGQDEYQES